MVQIIFACFRVFISISGNKELHAQLTLCETRITVNIPFVCRSLPPCLASSLAVSLLEHFLLLRFAFAVLGLHWPFEFSYGSGPILICGSLLYPVHSDLCASGRKSTIPFSAFHRHCLLGILLLHLPALPTAAVGLLCLHSGIL